MLSVKQGGIKYNFLKIFGMIQPEIESWPPGPLANTQFAWPMNQLSELKILNAFYACKLKKKIQFKFLYSHLGMFVKIQFY